MQPKRFCHFTGSVLALFLAVSRVNGQYLTARDVMRVQPADPGVEIPYGNDPNQYGQLRVPFGAGPHPVAIIIHGGCWMKEYDLQYVSQLADKLTGSGIATWSIEYRRLSQNGGGWPGTFQDAGAAADKLVDLSRQYSLELKKVIAIGHSAGGHLALWLGARNNLPRNSIIRGDAKVKLIGVLSLAGIPDLRQAAEQSICGDTASRLMGGMPADVPDHYEQGSPAELLPAGIPQVLVQGEGDWIVPPAVAAAYVEKAKAAGDDARVVVVPKAGHFELVMPAHASYADIRDAALALVK